MYKHIALELYLYFTSFLKACEQCRRKSKDLFTLAEKIFLKNSNFLSTVTYMLPSQNVTILFMTEKD